MTAGKLMPERRDHPFGLQLADRNVNGPLIEPRGTETITAQINAFADPHARVTNQ